MSSFASWDGHVVVRQVRGTSNDTSAGERFRAARRVLEAPDLLVEHAEVQVESDGLHEARLLGAEDVAAPRSSMSLSATRYPDPSSV